MTQKTTPTTSFFPIKEHIVLMEKSQDRPRPNLVVLMTAEVGATEMKVILGAVGRGWDTPETYPIGEWNAIAGQQRAKGFVIKSDNREIE